jgi:ammonium transporter, Amt family
MLHLDTGNTGFMILCCSLVMLMTPGLAFFYGGLVGRKNVLAIMIQSFVSMGWTTVLWWLCGFSMCFSGDLKSGTDYAGIVGNFHWAFLRGITLIDALAERYDSTDCILCISDDVRDHHAGADHGRVYEPGNI